MQETPIHSPYKVLIVDDSAIVRGLVTRMMTEDDEIEVVGSVNNGEEALAVMEGGGIEVVVLDIEMPVMDGLTALPKLLEIDPTVRVIMASTLTKRNADISFQAMTLGAVDYIPKPSSSKDLNVGEGFRAELLDKVKAWAEQRRKMLEVEEEAAAAREAAMPPSAETAPEPAAPSEETPSAKDGDKPDDASGGEGKSAAFRAEMSVEHQQLQKQGRIQRKRFTAELRPRPMQQHPRPQAMQMRQTPQQPAPAPQAPATGATSSDGSGPAAKAAAATPATSSSARPSSAPRDPGRLIRDAAVAADGQARTAGANPQRSAPVAPASRTTAPAPKRAAPAAPAPQKAARAQQMRGASAPAPAMVNRASGRAATIRGQASSRTRTPLRSSSRPMNTR